LCLKCTVFEIWRHIGRKSQKKTRSTLFDAPCPANPRKYPHKPYLAADSMGLSSACMADRPEMFGPTRGFSGMADSMEPCKCCGAEPYCHDNEISARRGHPVAYRLVFVTFCLIMRPPVYASNGRTYKMLVMFLFSFLFRHAFSEFPRPIALKLCHLVGICVYL